MNTRFGFRLSVCIGKLMSRYSKTAFGVTIAGEFSNGESRARDVN
jgi:hypothetical protein